jgi:hypothetical protein
VVGAAVVGGAVVGAEVVGGAVVGAAVVGGAVAAGAALVVTVGAVAAFLVVEAQPAAMVAKVNTAPTATITTPLKLNLMWRKWNTPSLGDRAVFPIRPGSGVRAQRPIA